MIDFGNQERPISYRQIRRRHCLAELRNALRRWGVVLIMFAGIAGAGAPVLAAGTVFPLFWSMAYPGWALVAVLAYSLAIGLLLWSARQLLWPRTWVEIERILPITPKQILVSDLEILSIALLPFGLVMLAGASLLLSQAPEWLRPFSGRAALSVVLVLMTSIGLSALGLRRLRRQMVAPPRRLNAQPFSTTAAGELHWSAALMWRPLSRRMAPRTFTALIAGGTVLPMTLFLPRLTIIDTTQALMLFSALALVVVTRVDALARYELGPLHQQCRMLPLKHLALKRALAGLVIAPAAIALVAWLLKLLGAPVRPSVLSIFMIVSLVGWILQIRSANRDAASDGARWFLTLILGVALASEVIR